MAYKRRTRDEYELYGWYDGEWSYVLTEDSLSLIKKHRREYIENEPGVPFKIIKRRIPLDKG